MRFSFIHDRLAMQLRQYTGVDVLMWGSDFPHSVGSFPDSRQVLAELFEGVPEDEKCQVLVANPCAFFGSIRNVTSRRLRKWPSRPPGRRPREPGTALGEGSQCRS